MLYVFYSFILHQNKPWCGDFLVQQDKSDFIKFLLLFRHYQNKFVQTSDICHHNDLSSLLINLREFPVPRQNAKPTLCKCCLTSVKFAYANWPSLCLFVLPLIPLNPSRTSLQSTKGLPDISANLWYVPNSQLYDKITLRKLIFSRHRYFNLKENSKLKLIHIGQLHEARSLDFWKRVYFLSN